MKIDYENLLLEFHNKFKHYIFFGYEVDSDITELRYKLIDEEVNKELLPILNILKYKYNKLTKEEHFDLMVDLADACADAIYVIVGTCISFGIPINEIFNEVHRSNMTKSMEKDTKSIKGKTIKGNSYEPPRIREILKEIYK